MDHFDKYCTTDLNDRVTLLSYHWWTPSWQIMNLALDIGLDMLEQICLDHPKYRPLGLYQLSAHLAHTKKAGSRHFENQRTANLDQKHRGKRFMFPRRPWEEETV